jgi:Mg2+-importing ATPase
MLGLATREFETAKQTDFCAADEAGLLFRGFLGFLDPLKASAIPAIRDFMARGIAIKVGFCSLRAGLHEGAHAEDRHAQVLTGDSLAVAQRLCAEMGVPHSQHGATGAQLMACDDGELAALVARCSVFAKVTPQQKMRIVGALQARDHIVGFLGDGTNDALALRKADVGVSVNSGEQQILS